MLGWTLSQGVHKHPLDTVKVVFTEELRFNAHQEKMGLVLGGRILIGKARHVPKEGMWCFEQFGSLKHLDHHYF